MVTSSLEKPGKVSFDSLKALRDELTRQSKNQERLREFQSTIDEAMKDGDKKGLLEFTETEWRTLISNENLPPIEEVKALLEKKIDSAKEVTAETKEKTGGLIDELQKKAEGLTGEAKKKMEELQQKAEGLKKYSKPALWAIGIGLSLKIWGYKIANWFSGLFGKKGEYDEKIKMIEMEKEFMRDPEAALKKYGAEALEKIKGGKTEQKESGVLEKVGPLAVLGGTGAGIFALLKNKLPANIARNLEGMEGKSFLSKLAKNRALRLFGMSGIALFGIGTLYEYIENHSTSLGEIPSDSEGKKSWWKKIIEKAGIGLKDGAEDIWAILTGEKVEEYFKERGPKPGYQFLSESDLLKDVKTKIAILANKLELIYKKDPKKFDAAFVGIGLFKTGLVLGAVGAGMKGIDLLKNVVKALYGSAKNHPLLWSLEIAMLGSQVEAVKHIQVKEGMTIDELSETIGDMASMDHIREGLDTMAPGFMNDSLNKTAEYLGNNCEKLSEEIGYISDHWQENLDAGMRNLLVTEDREKISNADKTGLGAFQKELQIAVQEKKTENTETLLGTDGKSGVIGDLIGKTVREEPLIESDIHKLIAATEGTNIRIFPEGGTQDGRTIQWVFVGKNGAPEGTAKNICINPLQSEKEKVEFANDFIYDPTDLGFVSKFTHEGWNTFRDLISEVSKSATSEPGKAKSAMERILGTSGSLVCFGGKMYVQYLDQIFLAGPANLLSAVMPGGKELSGQEFLVEYAGGMVPVVIVSSIKNGGVGVVKSLWKGKWQGLGIGKILAETITYPIKIPLDAGKYLYHKYQVGDYHIFENPAVVLKEGMAKKMRHIPGVSTGVKELGDLINKKDLLHEIHKKLRGVQTYRRFSEHLTENTMRDIRNLILDKKLLSLFPGRKIEDFTAGNWKEIFEETKAAIDRIHVDIETRSSKALTELKEKLAREPASLNPHTDIPKTKAELEKMRDICNEKIDSLEKEKQNMIQRRQSGHITDEELRQFMADASRRTASLHGYTRSIDAHIHAHTGEAGKWKKVGKGVLGLAALVGIMIGVQKLRADEPGKEIPELDGENGDLNFYGYRSEKETVTAEQKEGEDKKKENISDAPEYIQPFLTSLAHIKGMYGTEFDFISDPKALKESTDDIIMNRVNNLCKIHSQMTIEIKKLIKENKEPLKKYLSTLKEKKLYVGEANINAFFGIKEKDGKISLEYMDDDDFSDTIWEMTDFNRDNADEILAGNYDGWDQAWYITKRAAPLSGTYMDGADMVKNFQRGKTSDAFKSMGWMVVGGLCDVGMFFSFGGTGAGKAVINGGRAAIRWARMGKVIEAMRTAKNIMETTRIGTGFAKTMSLAITHSGTMNIVGVGADIGRQTIVFPRSESINIDAL